MTALSTTNGAAGTGSAVPSDDEEAVAAKVTEHLASGGELPEVPDGDEPINRGLLLKFLSSVRN